jgi:MSHA pilin protein MshC
MRVPGFTLIELIVVILLMAIVAAFAAPRFMGRGDFEGPAFAQELASAARYAQKLAVTSGCPVRLSIPDPTSYALFQPQAAPAPACDTVFTRPVVHPATGGAFAATAPPNVSIGGTVPLTVEFAASGAPAMPSLPLDQVITVAGRSVVIRAGSGYVDVP